MQDFGPNVGLFIFYSILTVIAVLMLSFAVKSLFGFEIGSGVNLLSAIMPGLFLGMRYAKRYGERPDTGALMAFCFTANFAMLVLSLGIALVTGFLGLVQEMITQMWGILLIALVVFWVLYSLASFAFFRLGWRNQMKTGG